VSRAGRWVRRERLIRSGQWTPTTALRSEPARPKLEEERIRALIADRDSWIAAVGITGWHREQARRRAARLARSRARRAS
jgi:hypothetical protein